MIDILQVAPVLDLIVKEREKYIRKTGNPDSFSSKFLVQKKDNKNGEDFPDYYPGYRIAADWLNQIKPHAEKGFFPEWLFENNSPHMTESEKKYVRENFRQYTLEVFKDLVDTNARGYHDGNYSIQWPSEADQYIKGGLTAKDFFTKDLPKYKSIETYTFEFQAPLKSMDAMGVNVVLPGEIKIVEREGKLVVDPDSMIAPYPEFFHTTKVVYFDNEVVIIEAVEKSEVDVAGEMVKEGLVFWIIDDTSWYQARQTGLKSDMKFEYPKLFDHELGYLPVIRSGGITIQVNDITMEQAPFLYAVDTLDQILVDHSLLSGSMANSCYPYRVMIGDPCEATMKVDGETIACLDGYFRLSDRNIECDTCHGSGMKDRINPLGVMLIKPPTTSTTGDSIKPSEALFYSAPSTETLDFVAKRIDYNFVKAYNLIHLRKDNSHIQGGTEVTATEISNENKALSASIATNSKQNFEILRFLIKTMGTIRYGDNFKMPEIKEPVSYEQYSQEEYLKKVAEVMSSDQPTLIKDAVIQDAATKLFFKDTESRLRFELIQRADRLMNMTWEEINIKQSKRLVDGYEIVLHDSSNMFIDELIETDPKFFEKPLSEQKQLLIDKAKAFALTIAPIQTSVIQTAQTRLNDLLRAS